MDANPAVAPAVAPAGQPNVAAVAPVTPAAGTTAPLFGGLRGGRPRKDGLVPGSPEALEADRKKDALRKQRERAGAKPPDPAPLPSAPVAGTASPPPGDSQPGLGPEAAPPLAWQPAMLTPLFAQLIPACEQVTVNQFTTRAEKARLPGDIIHEIEGDAKWSAPAKKALELSGPQVAAKWLNKAGISAENQPEVVFGTAVASILAGHMLLLRRLDKLIALQNQASARAPAPEKKP